MSTFFDTIKRPYQDVQITDKGINTTQFLEASESLVTMFGNPPSHARHPQTVVKLTCQTSLDQPPLQS